MAITGKATFTTISTVGGNIELLTEDNQNSRLLAIDNTFNALGGTYKIINLYYKAGLAYMYPSNQAHLANPVKTRYNEPKNKEGALEWEKVKLITGLNK